MRTNRRALDGDCLGVESAERAVRAEPHLF